MQRLIPHKEIENYDLTKIESPYFAGIKVREFFRAPYALQGLCELLAECNVSPVRCSGDDDQLTHRSVERRYGELRQIKQRYLEGDDNWQQGGKSWHWQPVTPDTAYEYKDAKQ